MPRARLCGVELAVMLAAPGKDRKQPRREGERIFSMTLSGKPVINTLVQRGTGIVQGGET